MCVNPLTPEAKAFVGLLSVYMHMVRFSAGMRGTWRSFYKLHMIESGQVYFQSQRSLGQMTDSVRLDLSKSLSLSIDYILSFYWYFRRFRTTELSLQECSSLWSCCDELTYHSGRISTLAREKRAQRTIKFIHRHYSCVGSLYNGEGSNYS